MNNPKISCPQALPAIFEEAKDEENWFIFAIGKADKKGKRPKQPVAWDKPERLTGAAKAAKITYARAMKRLKRFGEADLDEINRLRAEYAKENGKTAWEIEGYALGYLARDGSALIALDFDDCVEVKDGKRGIADKELRDLVKVSPAYVEVSTSGTGLRVFMPRTWGDDDWGYGSERGGVGCFADDRFGCVITGDVLRDGTGRDDKLFDLVKERHGAAGAKERVENRASIEEQIVEHGRREVEEFRDMVAAVKNDERFTEWGAWGGMIWAAREYYAVADPDRLDEVKEIMLEWSESWTDGDHDPDVFENVWNRDTNPGKAGATGLGSWIEHAIEGGWAWPDAEAVKPEPESKERLDRYAIVGGKWYDLKMRKERTAEEIVNETIHEDMAFVDKKGRKKPAHTKAERNRWLTEHLAHYEGEVFLPGGGRIVNWGYIEGRWRETEEEYVNTWRAPDTSGDARRGAQFADFVRRVYPDQADVLLEFLAWQIQRPGQKLQWGVLLIGEEGNGKDMMLTPIVKALGSHGNGNVPYSYILKDFNGWLSGCTFAVVQEAHKDKKSDMETVTERLKTTIADAAGGTIMIERKGVEAAPAENVVNVAITSNHTDALYVGAKSRRYYVAYSDEINVTPEEFARLSSWLKYGTGPEDVAAYLATYPIKIVKPGRAEGLPGNAVKVAQVAALPEDIVLAMENVTPGRDWFVDVEIKDLIELDKWMRNPRGLGKDIGNAAAVFGYYELKGNGSQGRWKFGGALYRVFTNGVFPDRAEIKAQIEKSGKSIQ